MGQPELEACAIRAATLYGQAWDAIPAHSKDKWRQAVQTAETQPHSAGETMMETCAQTAYREHLAALAPIPIVAEKQTARKPFFKVDLEPVKAGPKNKK